MQKHISKIITCVLLAIFACLHAAAQISGVTPPDHIVIVIEENHSFSEIIGSSSAPYINSLAQQGALFTHSFAIEHPSQPNYLDIFSGANQGVTSDNCPAGPFGSAPCKMSCHSGVPFSLWYLSPSRLDSSVCCSIRF